MSEFIEAVSWSGRGATFSLFAVFPDDESGKALKGALDQVAPVVSMYRLEDVHARLGGRQCYEYDLAFSAIPPDIGALVTDWIRGALDAGAEAAWFAFEGSFDFDHILAADVATQVFAMGSQAGIELAIEDSIRLAPNWAAKVLDVQSKAGL